MEIKPLTSQGTHKSVPAAPPKEMVYVRPDALKAWKTLRPQGLVPVAGYEVEPAQAGVHPVRKAKTRMNESFEGFIYVAALRTTAGSRNESSCETLNA